MFLKILFKFIMILIATIILRFSNINSNFISPIRNNFFVFLASLFKLKLSNFSSFEKKIITPQQIILESKRQNSFAAENQYLLRIVCWLFRINLDKDFESLLIKQFNISTEPKFNYINIAPNSKLNDLSSKKIYDLVENKNAFQTVDNVFYSRNQDITIENAFLHNAKNSANFLTRDASININFRALEDFYAYLKMFGDEERLSKFPAEVAYKPNAKLKKKTRIPKGFKGGLLAKNHPESKSFVTKSDLIRHVNTLKQVEFLIKNKALILSGKLKVVDSDFTSDVKSVMYSLYNPEGPYGNDYTLYSADLFSKNKLIVSRRINTLKDYKKIATLDELNSKVGFSNTNVTSAEEWENSADIPIGGWFTGQFYFINPLIVLGFFLYSFFEFFVLLYVMSFFFGNPFDNLIFFFKYPLVYYYENLASFPTPNYFFFSLIFWLYILIIFSVHILQLLDEDRFVPPQFSWAYGFSKDFFYNIFIWWCIAFCLFEVFSLLDLIFTRLFFIGTPGYPQLLAVLFLIFYDIFQLLGTVGYFSFYLEHFMHIDIKFPIFYYSDYTPLIQRYPLVQPYFIGDPYSNRPNFFLWLFDNVLNFMFGEYNKTSFFLNDSRFIFQRELVQDIRKYNYLRKNLLQLNFVGQLHNRGWNGFNYRLDLQNILDPIVPIEQVIRFDWRFKNTHTNGLYSRLFSPTFRFGVTTQRESVKTIRMLKGSRKPSRYGYLDYLKTIELSELNSRYHSWIAEKRKQRRKRYFFAMHKLGRGFKKSVRGRHLIKTYFFRPSKAKFRLLLKDNMPLRTKSDRNFRSSSLFFRKHLNFWSFVPGNSKPHRKSFYTPFVSFQDFSNIDNNNYVKKILLNNKTVSNRTRLKSQRINPYILRNNFFKQSFSFFPTTYINETLPSLKTELDLLYSENSPLFFQSIPNHKNQMLETVNVGTNKLTDKMPLQQSSLLTSKSRYKNLQTSKNLFFTKFFNNGELPFKSKRKKQPFFHTSRDFSVKKRSRHKTARKKELKFLIYLDILFRV